jgi:hypothetical protein
MNPRVFSLIAIVISIGLSSCVTTEQVPSVVVSATVEQLQAHILKERFSFLPWEMTERSQTRLGFRNITDGPGFVMTTTAVYTFSTAERGTRVTLYVVSETVGRDSENRPIKQTDSRTIAPGLSSLRDLQAAFFTAG